MRAEDFDVEAFDQGAYIEHLKSENAAGRCAICDVVAGTSDAVVIYRDEYCIAFFNWYPRLLGYVFVAPLQHRTAVVSDFTEAEYVELQRRVHRLGRAVSAVVPTERLYVLSFGANAGLAHVHWHLAPLPPGVPFDSQQFASISNASYLRMTAQDQRDLAAAIAAEIRSS